MFTALSWYDSGMEYKTIKNGWKVPLPSTGEAERLNALYDVNILETEKEESYDRITTFIAQFFDTPIALISLVEDQRQWFKSCFGLDASETSRDQSFCAHAIEAKKTLIVPDATQDDRFRENTLVTDDPNIRFYAGAPLITKDGHGLGSLCVIDHKPRDNTSEEQIDLLETMAQVVVDMLELRRISINERLASEAKSKFLANVSHEIRTPMNGIIGTASLLQQTNLAPDQRRYIDLICDSGDSLLMLVNDVLDLSKMEAGKLRLSEERFNLKSLMDGVVGLFEGAAKDKNIMLSLDYDHNAPQNFISDPMRLKQVVWNLVSNAIKFTSQGSVTLRVSTQKDQVKIAVIDTGIGIADDRKAEVFKDFAQVHEVGLDTNYGGTGLGLAISKRLVELLGGQISFTSQKGKGSVFWLTAPFQICEAEKHQDQDEGEQEAACAAQFSNHVLLAEDNDINQFVIGTMLQQMGVSYDLAEDGKAAADMAIKNDYDLILMDLSMPVIDGADSCMLIRQSEKSIGVHTPIIAITAHAFDEAKGKCKGAGFSGYLLKPLKSELLSECLEQWLKT